MGTFGRAVVMEDLEEEQGYFWRIEGDWEVNIEIVILSSCAAVATPGIAGKDTHKAHLLSGQNNVVFSLLCRTRCRLYGRRSFASFLQTLIAS